MEENNQHRYEILQRLAIAGAKGEELQTVVQTALQQAADLVGLTAAAVFLWNDKKEVSLAVNVSREDAAAERLKGLEDSMFSNLRENRGLLSAYMTFGGDTPSHAFTHPLSHRDHVFGAVIGLQAGVKTVVQEDLFLEALSAAVSLNVVASGLAPGGQLDPTRIEKERMGAIVETAVTVNHEINNPLTAILGNVQLLHFELHCFHRVCKTLMDVLQQIKAHLDSLLEMGLCIGLLAGFCELSFNVGSALLDCLLQNGFNSLCHVCGIQRIHHVVIFNVHGLVFRNDRFFGFDTPASLRLLLENLKQPINALTKRLSLFLQIRLHSD